MFSNALQKVPRNSDMCDTPTKDPCAAARREPELLAWSVEADSLAAEMTFPADAEWFSGHFPGFPVLPGVAQIFLTRKFARRAFSDFPDAGLYRRIKFRRLVRPGERAVLNIHRNTPGAFSFRMSVGDETAFSGEVEGLAG